MRCVIARLFILVCGIFGLNTFSTAQSVSLKLDNISTCNQSDLYLPLKGTGLSNIGALTLYLNYSSDQLTFVGLEDIDPQISGLIYHVLTNPSRISIVWSSTNGANFIDDILLIIKFSIIKNSGSISFAVDSCEVADANIPPQILTVNYQNGSYYSGIPVITDNPLSKTVFSQSNVQFSVNSPDATSYKWQGSMDNGHSWVELEDNETYEGTHSSQLKIYNVPVSFNGNIYRTEVFKVNCSIISDQAFLVVDSVSGVDELDKNFNKLDLYPNPFSEIVNIYSDYFKKGLMIIEFFSLDVRKKFTFQQAINLSGAYKFTLNCVSLPVGTYVCKIRFDSNLSIVYNVNKLVKVK